MYQEISRSKNHDKYTKELRKQHQAKLSSTLHRRTYERLGVKERLYDVEMYNKLSRKGPETTSDSLELLKGKLHRVRLSNLSIYPAVLTGTGREMIGTLEAYFNGFRFSPFQIDIMYSNVKHAFFQDGEENKAGDETISPLLHLHLHLHNPIKVGSNMENNIQFRMVHTSRGMKRSANRSCKFEDLNQVMRNFVGEVDCIWRRFPYLSWTDVHRVHGFKGELPLKEPRVLCLTEYCLVDLVKAPFLIVTLEEVEIASLVLVKPEMTVFNMTFVFNDFELGVLQIYSIPGIKLDRIEQLLDIRRVKYYENDNLDWDTAQWKSKLETIRLHPKTFMEEGGWDKFNSEETAADYSDSSAASIENYSSGMDYDSDKQSSHKGQKLEPPAELKEHNTYYANDTPGQVSSSGRKKRGKKKMPSTQEYLLHGRRGGRRGGGVGIVKSRV
ncbi:FACT complex subunit SPT16-like [Papaver somniferum]|uniref:FACT complex subunit SPT16-like n=1 Tax=Papaver somniferum TaxID=3469 RepID=UPI000E6FBF3C|nr:FACT complex subunit SPT16-like [Papaver somniferum]XP_026438837.1 FACT complex subunit SPT16-like [Papaver somniferum]XP_026438838.1 FACT complex subunit SPT16-like [Papaver somniferum]XP_026438839.1 FACT complex subunit SPT16-like [Papaver somniferum]